MPDDPSITVVDPDDDRSLDEWHQVERAATLPERPDAVLPSPRHRVEGLRRPTPYFSRTLLALRDGDTMVGIAELGFALQDNLHLADIQIAVLPSHRRRGLGRRLYDDAAGRCAAAGRTTLIGEAHTTATAFRALDFARALGFSEVHVENHLAMPLPMSADRRAALGDLVSSAPRAAAYEIVTWGDHCPEAFLAGYAAMRTQMQSDVPLGEVALDRVAIDEQRIRSGEEFVARSYGSVVAAVRRRSDGAFCGYSRVLLDHESTVAMQDDTLVMPEARGHRLGLALKLATLDLLLADHPERTSLHTWTAPDNHAMHATNRTFGFEPVEVLHEMQRTI